MEKTKIKTVCFPFVGDSIGGSHLSSLLLIEHLDRKCFNPVIVLHEKGVFSDYLDKRGLPYEILPILCCVGRNVKIIKEFFALLKTFFPIFSFIIKNKIDIVHTNDGRMHLTWCLPSKFAKAPLVWHQRTKFARSRFLSIMARLASKILCISEYVKKELPKEIKYKSFVVNNPIKPYLGDIKPENCRKKLINDAKAPENAKIIGTFGNLRDVKRPLQFIDSCILMQKQLKAPIILAVFGEDRENYIPRMKKMAKEADCENNLVFAGFQTPIEPWIAVCDLMLAPSVQDAFGRTLVEAMLVKTPVVATDAGGHSEIIENGVTGFLTPVDDAEKMAEAGLVFLNDENKKTQITNAAFEYAKRYNPDDYTKIIEAVYDKF